MIKPASSTERQAALDKIAQEVNACKKCPLYSGRTHGVPGAGPVDAEILFIGEGPGFHEDKQGLPFVGPSGRLLEELLATIHLTRDDVFISNVVKCRPPENRDPLPREIEICTTTYLFRQIDLINPKLIVTLGRYSMGLFFPDAKITQIHGQPKWENGRAYLPMFHPAAVLRNLAGLKPQAEADFKKIPGLVEEAKRRASGGTPAAPAKSDEQPPKPTQLSLF
ncbi:MAG TPA: uracil-DNA glycosylase [Aggregatilineales bacterium]|nr:uracil-DNA glycosylase [Aggregatilineales bacterium]